jgi:DNA replication licensing factor MCM4
VTAQDVKEAARLIRTAIAEYATDPLTGRIDMDLINTGHSTSERRQLTDLKREILKIVDQGSVDSSTVPLRYTDIANKINEQSSVAVQPSAFAEAVRALESEGLFMINGEGNRRIIRRVAGVAEAY